MLTRDQRYASTIYEQVTGLKAKEREEARYKPYGAIAHKLPILIRSAGLAQALEFVNSRGKPVQQQLLADLAATIGEEDTLKFLSHVRSAPLAEYMRLTQQTMAALLWYKRFAQSILGVDASEAAIEESEVSQ
jgi:CRISPR-associated protein Cmr5